MLQLRQLVPSALRPTARQARVFLRSLKPVAHTAPLDPARFEASLNVLRPFTLA